MGTTPAQSREALAVANERRLAISALRAQIHQHGYSDGMVFVAGLFRNPSAPVMAMRVEQLLDYVRRLSQLQIAQIMAKAGIMVAGRRVRDLTQRQRNVIAWELEQRASDYARRAA